MPEPLRSLAYHGFSPPRMTRWPLCLTDHLLIETLVYFAAVDTS